MISVTDSLGLSPSWDAWEEKHPEPHEALCASLEGRRGRREVQGSLSFQQVRGRAQLALDDGRLEAGQVSPSLLAPCFIAHLLLRPQFLQRTINRYSVLGLLQDKMSFLASYD